MRVAVWDILPAELFPHGTEESAITFVRLPLGGCRRALSEGSAEVTLLPVIDILQDPDPYDVLPAVAFSSWSFPFAKIVLKRGLGSHLKMLAYPREHDQAAFVARVILREHYHSEPQWIAVDEKSPESLVARAEDACLVIGPGVPAFEPGATALDLGQEWYELSNYPMVWGLFAARRGDATVGVIRAIRDAVVRVDDARPSRAKALVEGMKAFVQDELRLRLDDLATASLTELTNYAYFYGLTEDPGMIPFVSLPDEAEENGSPADLPSW